MQASLQRFNVARSTTACSRVGKSLMAATNFMGFKYRRFCAKGQERALRRPLSLPGMKAEVSRGKNERSAYPRLYRHPLGRDEFAARESAQTGKETEAFGGPPRGISVGSDKEFHDIAYALGIDIVLHLPTSDKDQAVCHDCIRVLERKPHLRRNRDIVDAVIAMIAVPYSEEEQIRSGTWATIRYARKVGRKLYVIFPDGTVDVESSQRGDFPKWVGAHDA